jgi:hypothetical protein
VKERGKVKKNKQVRRHDMPTETKLRDKTKVIRKRDLRVRQKVIRWGMGETENERQVAEIRMDMSMFLLGNNRGHF